MIVVHAVKKKTCLWLLKREDLLSKLIGICSADILMLNGKSWIDID